MPNVEKVYKEYIEGINDSELKSKFTEEIKRIKESNDIKAFEEFDRKLQNVSSSDIKALEKVLGDMKGAEGAGNPRNMSGVAIGGENLSNPIKSMRGSNGNIGFVPKEVADNLRGREFNSFDDFRNAFWQEYSTSNYASEFSKANIKRMSKGLAPKAPASQQYKNISSYVLHHKNPIYNGGGVYDLDNIIITSPRMHQEILDKGFHFNK